MSIFVCRFLVGRYCVRWVLCVLAFCGFGSSFAHALDGEQPEAVHQLDPMVVTATKTPVPLSQLTSAVEVFSEKDFLRQNVRLLTDALQFGQGLAVFTSGGPGSNATARIRGGSSSQTLVFIDGALVNSATLGEFNIGMLTTDNIQSVTILRGAQSMLWGADAMGGVIDIKTKRGEGTPTARAFSEYGSFNTIREGGSVGGKMGPVDFTASLSRWDSARFSSLNYRRGAVERDAYRNWTASTLLGVALPQNGRFEFSFRWNNTDVEQDNPSDPLFGGPYDVFTSKASTTNLVFSGLYSQPLTDWWDQRFTISRAQESAITRAGDLQRSVTTGLESVPGSFLNSEIRTKSNRIEWQHNFRIGDPWLLTLGYQFREQLGTNEGQFSNKLLSSHSGFAQVQLNLWDRLFATAGFRQEASNTFGDATTYRVTGGYLLKETGTKLRASYATGFRAPTINELFFPDFGNPNLQPEKSQSLDVGVDQSLFQKRLTMSVGYFWNRFRQLITPVFDPVGCAGFTTFGFCAQNIGSAKTQGWETSLKWVLVQDMPFIKELDFQGQYTYTLTRDLMTGDRLPRWPVHQGSATLSYQPISPLVITLSLRYVGSRFNTTGNREPLPDFHILNMAASYNFTPAIQGYVRAENLLNRHYEEVLYFGTPVRSVFGGIRVSFDIPVGKSTP
ncbi:MAG: TonB-dependent receptor [Nitrospirota bacterium]|nr:TonB-dependent receptor [Nitrospirota bacterium]